MTSRLPLWLDEDPFVVVDIETTGLNRRRDHIVQIAALLIDDGEISEEWATLVRPPCPIPVDATRVHGIDDAAVVQAPTFKQVAPAFVDMCRGRTVIGYNAASFDVPFIRAKLEGVGMGNRARAHPPLDVLLWVRALDLSPEGNKLTQACARWGVALDNAHDALSDCTATWHLLAALARAHRFPVTTERGAGGPGEVVARPPRLVERPDGRREEAEAERGRAARPRGAAPAPFRGTWVGDRAGHGHGPTRDVEGGARARGARVREAEGRGERLPARLRAGRDR